jgi:type I restriction enzyme R subunit
LVWCFIERLRAAIAAKVSALAAVNPARIDWVERFQRLIDNAEERRGLAENLSEEELAVYDLLMRPAPELNDAEKAQVKGVAQSLLEKLKREKLVLDWRRQQQTRAAVQVAVADILDGLPTAHDQGLYKTKCEVVYLHIFDSYWDDGRSVYSVN